MALDKTFGELPVDRFRKLSEEFGTPFYLYDADAINARIQGVRRLFGDTVKVYYAVKANPNLRLLQALKNTADGLDISSGGELQQALLAGYGGQRLSFAGPAKTVEELTDSIENDIGCISIESERELDDVIKLCEDGKVRANIVVRINPALMIRDFGLKMGGKATQFGIDEEVAHEFVKKIMANSASLNFRGVHIYAGSQCFDADAIQQGVENTFRIVKELESNLGIQCKIVNLGGGFGVSHTKKHTELDVAALAENLTPVVQSFQDSVSFKREIVFELGRYLTASAGMYVTKVISSKESRGKTFFALDGGLNHHLAAAGTFGAALRSNFVVVNLSQPDAVPMQCELAGPSCNPTDLLGINVNIPTPRHGDLIGIMNSGSYGLTASPILFLGRSTPAEILIHNGEFQLARAPRPMTDFN